MASAWREFGPYTRDVEIADAEALCVAFDKAVRSFVRLLRSEERPKHQRDQCLLLPPGSRITALPATGRPLHRYPSPCGRRGYVSCRSGCQRRRCNGMPNRVWSSRFFGFKLATKVSHIHARPAMADVCAFRTFGNLK